MGIKELFLGGDSCMSKPHEFIDLHDEKREPKITFESDKELLEKCRYVKVGNQVIGYLVTKGEKWEWLQIKEECGLSYKIDIIKQLSMEIMIAITEKLKELNGCSDDEVNLTYDQKVDITKEINCIRKRIYDISNREYAKKQAKAYKGCVLCELEGRGLCNICKIGICLRN